MDAPYASIVMPLGIVGDHESEHAVMAEVVDAGERGNSPEEEEEEEEDDEGDPDFHTGIANLPFKCTACARTFQSASSRYRHMREAHCGEFEEKKMMVVRLFPCAHCPRAYSHDESLRNHMRERHPHIQLPVRARIPRTPVPLIECRACPFLAMNEWALHQHEHAAHGAPFPARGPRPYHCVVCRATFGQRKDLVAHAVLHKGVGDLAFGCHLCHMAYASKEAREEHVAASHGGVQPYACSNCQARFTTADRLVRHERETHDASNLYACSLCGVTFSSPSRRRAHRLTHHSHDAQ